MDGILTLRLNIEEAIIHRNALMFHLQSLPPELRSDIQKELEKLNLFIQINLRDKPLDKSVSNMVE